MSEEDVYRLLERVRTYYQHLSRSDELCDEWFRILKHYKVSEVNENLDKYLSIERNRNRIPMPQDLIQDLWTIEESEQSQKSYVVNCNLCKKPMTLENYNKHYDRCCSIHYLLQIMKSQGIKIEYKDLASLNDNKFNAIYEKYKNY